MGQIANADMYFKEIDFETKDDMHCISTKIWQKAESMTFRPHLSGEANVQWLWREGI